MRKLPVTEIERLLGIFLRLRSAEVPYYLPPGRWIRLYGEIEAWCNSAGYPGPLMAHSGWQNVLLRGREVRIAP